MGSLIDGATMGAAKGRVLLVDDEPMLLRSIERVLRRGGYEVECVTRGDHAMQRIGEGHFDVVVSDIAMPGMTGIELLRSVRERHRDLPVVLMTGEPAIGTALEAVELGALQYLTKPLEALALEEVIAQAVGLRRSSDANR